MGCGCVQCVRIVRQCNDSYGLCGGDTGLEARASHIIAIGKKKTCYIVCQMEEMRGKRDAKICSFDAKIDEKHEQS